jgi:hypothetical protein
MVMDSPWTVAKFTTTLIMWTVMMALMMLPSSIPMLRTVAVASHGAKSRGESGTPVALVEFGYVLAWTVFSIFATMVQLWFHGQMLLSSEMALTNERGGGPPHWRRRVPVHAGQGGLSRPLPLAVFNVASPLEGGCCRRPADGFRAWRELRGVLLDSHVGALHRRCHESALGGSPHRRGRRRKAGSQLPLASICGRRGACGLGYKTHAAIVVSLHFLVSLRCSNAGFTRRNIPSKSAAQKGDPVRDFVANGPSLPVS